MPRDGNLLIMSVYTNCGSPPLQPPLAFEQSTICCSDNLSYLLVFLPKAPSKASIAENAQHDLIDFFKI
jgi:hypothetical protein